MPQSTGRLVRSSANGDRLLQPKHLYFLEFAEAEVVQAPSII